ncbi:hypothetical protein NKOR_00370 [Candidatus Nitrosopumilus koreensis AR1]|uniref:Glycosyltransferase RgtA/B/C/D-like domain-containing protein n=2 Tax=Nitrosopumilus TaxID=338191 RepID=K0B684_9ARCH|nr:hypothetical protein [Candidatus Nitrosopumilus koreensis]AFS79996.1 hypothetical protein NKOR_00370 [Candidatus Nitrosopumilus koreensis AR1]
MSVLRTEVTGYDSLTSKISNSQNEIERGSSSIGIYNWISEGIVNFVKMLGWAAIPSFVLILPIGFFLMWKNREPTKISITALIVIFAIPAFYGYSVKAFDTRYLFLLYPIFCIVSLYPIKKIYDRVSKKDLLLILSTSCIVLASIGFFEYQNEESQREFEAYQLSFIVAEKTKIINQYIPESGYLPIVGLTEIEEFPILRNQFNDSNDISKCLDPRKCNGLIPITNVSLEEFIKNNKESGLTHIIVDDSEHFLYRVQFLKNVFENENEFPYLIKEFDSQEEGFTYHMKIFRIDYDIFENVYDS